ncbi:MAG TPA: acyltransferase family protein [Spirochaetia bacterium]|nr:acyltransferase family protein [Spirochaetia bacterium]
MQSREKRGREVSIDYLRAFVTLLVLAHHSSLAYTTFAHLDTANYLLSTAPIVDSQRWGFLDYAENFNDVFFMSLMFFISGLFVWPTLGKKAVSHFLRDRLLRLGLPFLVGAAFLMPVAYYPSWLVAGGQPGYFRYWLGFLRNGWSPGPLWFVWLLLLFDVIAAGVWLLFRKHDGRFAVRSAPRAFLIIFVVSFFAYVPMLARFGFGTWVAFLFPPLYFQIARIFLYLTWFFAGVLIGSGGIATGFLAEKSPFARHWPWWIAVCLLAYNLLWFVPGIIEHSHGSSQLRDLSYVTFWVFSCCASCFGLLALFRGVFTRRRKWMDSIARAAYIMYIVHYVYVIWTQYLLLGLPASAGVKFSITCALAISVSWLSARLLLRVPVLKSLL